MTSIRVLAVFSPFPEFRIIRGTTPAAFAAGEFSFLNDYQLSSGSIVPGLEPVPGIVVSSLVVIISATSNFSISISGVSNFFT